MKPFGFDYSELHFSNLAKNPLCSSGIKNYKDNCVKVPNADQIDRDGDNVGDACDSCPYIRNPDQVLISCCTLLQSIWYMLQSIVYSVQTNSQSPLFHFQMDVDNDLIGDPCDTNKDRYGQFTGLYKISDACDTNKDRIGQNAGLVFAGLVLVSVSG